MSYNKPKLLRVPDVYAEKKMKCIKALWLFKSGALFLNRQATASYRALVSIIPGRERFSWNLSF
jgi:hypothetical protein